MIEHLKRFSLAHQLGLVVALFCLLVSLALVILAAISNRHMLLQQQSDYGQDLAHQVAQRVGTAMENGDLLRVAASLNRYTEHSAAVEITVTDIEDKPLGHAGNAEGPYLYSYFAPIMVESHIAGGVEVVLDAAKLRAAQKRYVLSLLGLALLLSLVLFGLFRLIGQRHGQKLLLLADALALNGGEASTAQHNEYRVLEQRVAALPMDLLRNRSEPGSSSDSYKDAALLYLHLPSLQDYVKTLSQESLHLYIDRLHQVIYAAAGFYAGKLEVTRQFGLTIYFNGHSQAGSPAYRAAASAWLVREVCQTLEKSMSLSLRPTMAVAVSELGASDEADIYPGLYVQYTLDELQSVCANNSDAIWLSSATCSDADIADRVQVGAAAQLGYGPLCAFGEQHQDLLNRQFRLIMQRLNNAP